MAITKKGESQEFGYTGDIQEFIAPFSGVYALECYGAGADAAKGAYSIRHVSLNKGDRLYIVVGGAGAYGSISKGDSGTRKTVYGGYNGGGNTYVAQSRTKEMRGYSGAGATHIATVSGELKDLKTYKDTGEILIVAGGSSGCSKDGSYLSGSGEGRGYSEDAGRTTELGGVDFGQGGFNSSYTYEIMCGGGGGWYGGAYGWTMNLDAGTNKRQPYGGSSYIGTAADTSTSVFGGTTYTNSITAGGATT